MSDFTSKDTYTITDLVSIVAALRAPDGCPWDREQTHTSLRTGLIEECYEVLDAIDAASPEKLQEELGDVLLQVVFHAQLEAETGSFDLDAVADGICKKLIYRHPHVFAPAAGDETLDPAEVLRRWDKLKDTEKHIHTAAADLAAVPAGLPALLRAKKLQKRAARYGYGTADAGQSIEKLQAALTQLQTADSQADRAAAYGRALFYLTDAGRHLGLEAEVALRDEANAFVQRTLAQEQ